MIEKLINKGTDVLVSLYQDDPLITILSILIIFVFIFCCIKLFKYLIVIFFTVLTLAVLALCVNSYLETRSLEYQLAQQMISEHCVDTIDFELYLKYENITFVDGKQYRYGQNPKDSIARNYVCHSSRRTYSVDFLLEVYKDRPTLNDHINNFKEDVDMLVKALNSKGNVKQSEKAE